MQTGKALVVLIHGIASSRLSMWTLERRLRAEGFATHNWAYIALFKSVAQDGQRFYRFLQQQATHYPTIHIVAHSMGCIVTRSALSLGSLPALGRIVFLAPPNTGSPVASLLAPAAGRWLKPLSELADTPTSLVNQLSKQCGSEVGIIAARYDLLVPERCTRLHTETDYVMLPHTHNSLLLSKQAFQMTLSFIRTGHF